MSWKTLAAAVLGLSLIWATGCDGKKDAPKPDAPKPDEDQGHAHGSGPHGGVIIELDKYHGEFKPDHGKKEATVWLLKGDAKSPARVKTDKLRLVVSNTNPKIEIDLLPTDTDKDGTASTFVGKHDGFGVEMEYKGTVSAQIDGKPYSGDFEEKPEPKK
jgi:hypothetical protein